MAELIAGAVISIVSFTIGAIIGQRVKKDQPIIQIPKPESFEERRARNLEIERNKTMLENIDNYDGTSLGQQRLE
jgi:hypothetical protein